MLRVIVAVVLILSMAVVLTAQNEELSREELRQRREQLNAQAEQIRQETGFEGRIEVRPETNRITRFRGNFEDIRVPAIEDTSGFEQEFDEILNRLLPYFPVDRADLAKENISSRITRISIRYTQTANGYSIEGPSGITVYYNINQDLFVINNGLAYLDPAELPTEPVITEEEAIRIYLDNVEINIEVTEFPEYMKHLFPDFSKPRFSLMYGRKRSQETGYRIGPYRLCWIGGGGGGGSRFTIDALTGEILADVSTISPGHSANEAAFPETDQENYDDTPDPDKP